MSESRGRSGLTKQETRQSLESFNWSLTFRSGFITVCAPTTFVFAAFALSLGLPKERMGLITAVASFACIIQMLSLIVTTRVKNRKSFILSVALAEPLLMIAAILLLPFLAPGIRLYALAAVVFMAAASMHLTQPLTQDWLATTIPAGVRGRYLGRRFQLMSAAIIVTTLIAGQAVERIGKTNIFGLACLLAAGGTFGIAAVIALRRATMPAVAATSRVTWPDIPNTLKNRTFRRHVTGVLLYNLPFLIAVPYYQVFNLKILGMRESFIAYMVVGYYLVRIVATPLLGRYLDRKGPRHALLTFGPAYILFFIGLSLSTPARIWPTVLAWLLAGCADAAYVVSITGALYASVPNAPGRPAYFAVANLFALATYGVGALTAVPILEALKGVSFHIGPLVLGQFQCLFAICTVMMVPCILGARFLVGPRQSLDRAQPDT